MQICLSNLYMCSIFISEHTFYYYNIIYFFVNHVKTQSIVIFYELPLDCVPFLKILVYFKVTKGLINCPFLIISKCKCGPVLSPVFPLNPIISSCFTRSPCVTYSYDIWAYLVFIPFS